MHAVETMAFAGETPWHGLGFKVPSTLTPAEMLKAAKLDWYVEKRPLYATSPRGDEILIPDTYGLFRTSDDAYLDTVGKIYKPVQNEAVFEFFARFCKAGKMKMETAGSLWGGRYVWCLARINHDFAVAGNDNDAMHNYVLLCSPHAHGKAMVIQFTPIRVVCWNTLTFALGASFNANTKRGGWGEKAAFRLIHSKRFDQVAIEQATTALGLALVGAESFEQSAKFLASKKAKPERVEEFFGKVLSFDAAKAKKTGAPEPFMFPKLRQALETSPGHDLPTAAGTWWGALNAVTYVVDHETGRNRSTTLRNVWLGDLAAKKRTAFELATTYAKAA